MDNRIDKNDGLLNAVEDILRESTYGSVMTIRKWITLSLHKISKILENKYFLKVSYNIMKKILKKLGYSYQSNKKMN